MPVQSENLQIYLAVPKSLNENQVTNIV